MRDECASNEKLALGVITQPDLSGWRRTETQDVREAQVKNLMLSLSGIAWKAQLIVAHERGRIDSLAVPLDARLIAKNLIDEILAEEN
ncbi:hypothetical protein AB8K35_26940 (plasmid) [Klebsiella pneumoniae]|uniref:hypothetical protein n=1 Tax=Klebsiella pneumoniae TaxID=573 RepID=UPI003D42B31E